MARPHFTVLCFVVFTSKFGAGSETNSASELTRVQSHELPTILPRPREVKGLFSVSTTSRKNLKEVLEEIHKAIETLSLVIVVRRHLLD